MTFAGTLLIYFILGLVVASALLILELDDRRHSRVLTFLLGFLFWPIFAPFVLSANRPEVELGPEKAASETKPEPVDPLARRITAAETALRSALSQIAGLESRALDPELLSIARLSAALVAQSKRLTEMEALLELPEWSRLLAQAALSEATAKKQAGDGALLQSLESRLANVDRLHTLRDCAKEDLERSLLKMEELAARVLLLKFDTPCEGELLELIRDLAASVDGLTEGLSGSPARVPPQRAQPVLDA